MNNTQLEELRKGDLVEITSKIVEEPNSFLMSLYSII